MPTKCELVHIVLILFAPSRYRNNVGDLRKPNTVIEHLSERSVTAIDTLSQPAGPNAQCGRAVLT